VTGYNKASLWVSTDTRKIYLGVIFPIVIKPLVIKKALFGQHLS